MIDQMPVWRGNGFVITRFWLASDDGRREQKIQITLPDDIADVPWSLSEEKAAQLIAVLSGLPVEPEEVNTPSLDDL